MIKAFAKYITFYETGQICCDGLTCYDPETQQCCGDGNGTLCDVNETCCNGECCDPSEHCENGQCVCNTCWTTKKEPTTLVPCSACSGNGCPGMTGGPLEHYVWVAAGPGQAGWCKNPTKEEVVGFWYDCAEEWDVQKIEECIAESIVCHVICKIIGLNCVVCLIAEGIECASGGLCTFVRCIPGEKLSDITDDVVDYEGDMGKSCFVFTQ